jgi:hypothetical protein
LNPRKAIFSLLCIPDQQPPLGDESQQLQHSRCHQLLSIVAAAWQVGEAAPHTALDQPGIRRG